MRCVPLSLRHVCTYFLVLEILCGKKKYQIFVLFLELVTLTFDLQTSIGFLLSPLGMCVPRFIQIRHFVLKISCRNEKYQIFVLFLEVVTFVLQSSISIGFLLSPPGMCVPSFIQIRHFILKILCGNEKVDAGTTFIIL